MRRLIHGQFALGFGQTRASDPFQKFKPEPHHEVRQADVTGQSLTDQVKRTKEMLRSLDQEKVKQVIEFHKGLDFFEALALAKREGKLIVTNDIHDRILMETKDPEERSSLGDRDFNRSREICSTEQTDRDRRSRDKKYFEENYPLWTGTLVIYEKPDKPFGKEVNFGWEDNGLNYSVSFKIPKQFQRKTNCALVVEHPDFELVNLGNNRYEIKVVDGSSIRLVQDFPKKNGWHLKDHGIPIVAKEHSNSRYLWRTSSSYIGPLGRGDFVGYGRCGFVADVVWSGDAGVALMPLASERSDSHG